MLEILVDAQVFDLVFHITFSMVCVGLLIRKAQKHLLTLFIKEVIVRIG